VHSPAAEPSALPTADLGPDPTDPRG
jgi:hypothetical protein